MSSIERADNASKRIGETLRYVAFGIIATDFGILTLKIEFFKGQLMNISQVILWSLGLSIIGLMCDYLHALSSYINEKYKYEYDIDESEKGLVTIYFLGFLFFYLKQVLIITASLLLIIVVWKVTR